MSLFKSLIFVQLLSVAEISFAFCQTGACPAIFGVLVVSFVFTDQAFCQLPNAEAGIIIFISEFESLIVQPCEGVIGVNLGCLTV